MKMMKIEKLTQLPRNNGSMRMLSLLSTAASPNINTKSKLFNHYHHHHHHDHLLRRRRGLVSLRISGSHPNRIFTTSTSTDTNAVDDKHTTSNPLSSPLIPHDVGGFEDLLSSSLASSSLLSSKDTPNRSAVDGGSDTGTGTNVQFWERQCHALFAVLASKQYMKTDELRRTIEALGPSQYVTWSYYEKWTAAMVSLLLESNIITYHELYRALTGNDDGTDGNRDSLLDAEIPLFQPGDIVRVRPYENCSRSNNRIIEWKRPHIRTPGYIYGVKGRVVDVCGRFGDPSILAFFNLYSRTRKGPTNNFHHDGGSDDDENTDENRDTLAVPSVWLYRVEVSMSDLWPEQSTSNDVVSVEVYEHWLERTTWSSPGHSFQDVQLLNHDNHGQDSHGQNSDCTTDHHLHDHHHHHHDHHHDGDHSHDPRIQVERRAVDQEGQSLRPGKELFYALLQIIVDDKKLVSRDELRTMVEALEKSAASLTGATLVVKAWTDPGFRQRLLDDPVTAAREVGIVTSNPNAPTVLTVVESTPEEHQLVVCTLCSCYPSGLLGISPSWYRDRIYRARAVREPRKVLEEFGTILPPKTKIRVHDSTADHRYLVLPQRPDNTDGWSEEDLRKLVSRDSMIGVTIPTTEML